MNMRGSRDFLCCYAVMFSAIAILAAAPSPVAAQTKEEILSAYRDYTAAQEAGNKKKALAYARTAYEGAKKAWGDADKQTAALAANYGYALVNTGKWSEAAAVFDDCVTLLKPHDQAIATRVECLTMAGRSYFELGKSDEARARYDAALASADTTPDSKAQKFAGDALLGLAKLIERPSGPRPSPRATIGSGETSSRLGGEIAEEPALDDEVEDLVTRALARYEAADEQKSLEYAWALRVLGTVSENRKDFKRAQDLYARAGDTIAAIDGESSPRVFEMRGAAKLMEATDILERKDAIDYPPSREPGKNCTIGKSRGVEMERCVILRIPPYYPNDELYKGQRGFALLRYDINENGRSENPAVVVDWPGGEFTERALKSLKGSQFQPPTDMQGNVAPYYDVHTIYKFVIGEKF